MLNKVSEEMNHKTTRNSDLLISRMFSEMAEKKALSKSSTQALQFDRLLQDRRRLSRFITEPSTLQLGTDAKWSIKDIDEVANPEFWKMLERDRLKEITREDVGKMVFRQQKEKMSQAKSLKKSRATIVEMKSNQTPDLGRMTEQKFIKQMIEDDIQDVIEKEDESAIRATRGFVPSFVVIVSQAGAAHVHAFSPVQADGRSCLDTRASQLRQACAS